MFFDILKEKNKKMVEAFEEEIDELPDGYSFCTKCMSFKKTSLEQEIKHFAALEDKVKKDQEEYVKRKQS